MLIDDNRVQQKCDLGFDLIGSADQDSTQPAFFSFLIEVADHVPQTARNSLLDLFRS
jgi:hypothetical protein